MKICNPGWIGALLLCGAPMVTAANTVPYDVWLTQFKSHAAREGIPTAVLNESLTDLIPDDDVLELDQKQPEKKATWTEYLRNTVTSRRVAKGRELLEEYRDQLEAVAARYHVQPEYIVALWGIESDYGNNKGDFSVLQSLATLAYDGRRKEFFEKELLAALRIITRENIDPLSLTGSWAGAMGDCQFMPSTYINHAADGDNDGRRDIWSSPPDIFASIANYLHSLDWDDRASWGRAVTLPADFAPREADIKHARSIHDWRVRGVTLATGEQIPKARGGFYAVYPGTPDEGAYLVTENYQALLQWNRSRYFATAVGILADRISE